jgi:hypothetical protein
MLRLVAGTGGEGEVFVAERKRERDVLPELTPIPDLDVIDPLDLLSDEEREALRRELDDMARARRKAEATSGQLRLS